MVRPILTFSCRDLVVAFASPEETRYGLFSWQKHEVPCCTNSAIISSREIESIQWLGGDSRGTLPDGSPEIGLARWGWISRNLNLQRALRTREAALYLVNVVRRTYIVRPWRVHNSALRRIHSTHTHLPPLFIFLPTPRRHHCPPSVFLHVLASRELEEIFSHKSQSWGASSEPLNNAYTSEPRGKKGQSHLSLRSTHNSSLWGRRDCITSRNCVTTRSTASLGITARQNSCLNFTIFCKPATFSEQIKRK